MSSTPACTIVLHVAGDSDDEYPQSPTLAFGGFSTSSASSSTSTLCDLDPEDLLTVPGAAHKERFRKANLTIERHRVLVNPRLARLRPAWTTAEDPDDDRIILVPNESLEPANKPALEVDAKPVDNKPALEVDNKLDDDDRRNRFHRPGQSETPTPKRKSKSNSKDRKKSWELRKHVSFFGAIVTIVVLDALIFLLRLVH
ncbi:hypothetical protein BD310DRAFT_70609 [Dichomitus squalens]|uniref:Uncharacterized protein n=1 Tax=Dichomitus squalens TaxID=114155 RepID=A0A4Q9PKD6_9APHY|nr:hypothetical protein BD310DRAFT_70609 [Dichomitus squalens]